MMTLNWQNPRRPNYTSGMVVFHADDAVLTAYTHWFPIIARAIFSSNQFRPGDCGVLCPCANAGYADIGYERNNGLPVMSISDMQDLVKKGGEIVSHGKYHIFLGYTNVKKPVSAGDTKIYHLDGDTRFIEGLSAFITEGEITESFMVTSIGVAEDGYSYVETDNPLTNSYTTAAKLHLTEEAIIENTQGIVDLLSGVGIECKQHVNAWYESSPISDAIMQNVFESVVKVSTSDIPTPQEMDLYNLPRTKDIRWFTPQEIDQALTETRDKDTVLFVQGHGSARKEHTDNLKYFVEKAIELGIRIVTHSEAIEFIKSKQQI